MANGAAAAAAGMDTVSGTDDRREGYDEINKTRDYVAGVKVRLPSGTIYVQKNAPTSPVAGDVWISW